MDTDIRSIVNENDEAVKAAYHPESFEHLFWSQQRKSMLQSRWDGIQWSSSGASIYGCWEFLSIPCSPVYRSIKAAIRAHLTWLHQHHRGKIGLPKWGGWTVRQGGKRTGIGWSWEVYCTHFWWSEDLVYNKHSGELVGFVNVTDINKHLVAFEKICQKEVSGPCLASHMLVEACFPLWSFPMCSSQWQRLQAIHFTQ